MFQICSFAKEHATLDPRAEESLSSWVQGSFQTLLYPGALILSFFSQGGALAMLKLLAAQSSLLLPSLVITNSSFHDSFFISNPQPSF